MYIFHNIIAEIKIYIINKYTVKYIYINIYINKRNKNVVRIKFNIEKYTKILTSTGVKTWIRC